MGLLKSTLSPFASVASTGVLITLLFGMVPVSRSVPVIPRWKKPCESKNSVSIETPIVSPNHPLLPVTEHLEGIISLLRTSTQDLNQLEQDYVRRRFSGSSEIVRSMESWKLDGLPDVSNSVAENLQLEIYLKETYNHYVRIIIFMQEAIADEITYEAPYKTSLHEVYDRYVQTHAYDVLCHLYALGNQHEIDLSVTVTESIMSASLRDIEAREHRHKRDYVVIREFHKLALHSLKSLSNYKVL